MSMVTKIVYKITSSINNLRITTKIIKTLKKALTLGVINRWTILNKKYHNNLNIFLFLILIFCVIVPKKVKCASKTIML